MVIAIEGTTACNVRVRVLSRDVPSVKYVFAVVANVVEKTAHRVGASDRGKAPRRNKWLRIFTLEATDACQRGEEPIVARDKELGFGKRTDKVGAGEGFFRKLNRRDYVPPGAGPGGDVVLNVKVYIASH